MKMPEEPTIMPIDWYVMGEVQKARQHNKHISYLETLAMFLKVGRQFDDKTSDDNLEARVKHQKEILGKYLNRLTYGKYK